MIDHVTANVGDFEQAKRFYKQVLAPLGYSVQMEFEGAAGFGTGEGIPDFWIGSSSERGRGPRRVQCERSRDGGRVPRGRDGGGWKGAATALPACARTITRTTTRPMYTMRLVTTSRPCATNPGDGRRHPRDHQTIHDAQASCRC